MKVAPWLTALLGLLLLACPPTRVGDGQGYLCAVDADCPSPYRCVSTTCQSVTTKDHYLVAATSDVACSPSDPEFNDGGGTSKLCRALETAQMAEQASVDAVLLVGNLQRDTGAAEDFQHAFDVVWGAPPLRSLLRPVPGPRDYGLGEAAGFFATFPELLTVADGKGYGSFDLGPWHLVGLNSNCAQVGGCDAASAQGRWLAEDLAASHSPCLLAFFYGARFGSGQTSPTDVQPFWDALYARHADVILSSNDDLYERFAPLDPAGNPDDAGITSFIVGTGGARLGNVTSVAPYSQVLGATYGLLELTLSAGSFSWSLTSVADQPLSDHGSATCHPKP